jgi:pimeloyl-ACP methyl ester carboxylesterase
MVMRRQLLFISSFAAIALVLFVANKFSIRHETFSFYDAARGRTVEVQISVRRDKEMQAAAGLTTLPVAILNHGNTVRFTEYSFLSNVFAARGYLAMSVQHDLPTDAPLVTKVGEPYVGRLPVYQRGIANIAFSLEEMKAIEPNADYDRLTMVGHSNGGDISMYYAKLHPDQVKKIVTLDNLRVPFMTDGKFKIISFRSEDPVFKPDPGVVPDDAICNKAGITVVKTGFQHVDMSDRGPAKVKTHIQSLLDKYLSDDDATGAVAASTSIPTPVSTPASRAATPALVATNAAR